jgi:hypothetical protein
MQKKNLLNLNYNRHDLLNAPRLIEGGIAALGERAVVVRYEDLVRTPHATVRTVCNHLAIDFDPRAIEYEKTNLPTWQFGDQATLYDRGGPSTKSIEKWKQLSEQSPQNWRLLYDYLVFLGSRHLEARGYDYNTLKAQLSRYRPPRWALRSTFSLDWVLSRPRTEPLWWEKVLVWSVKAWRESQRLVRHSAPLRGTEDCS